MADDKAREPDDRDDEPQPENDLAEGLAVDWEALAVAVENQLPSAQSYLNLSSGRVQTVRGKDGAADMPPEQEGDWIVVPPRSSGEGYGTMQRFVEQLSDPALQERLAAALVGRGAFRRFKDLLLHVPEQRQAWFAFKDAEVYQHIANWLEREGIISANVAPEITSRTRISAAVRRSSLPPPASQEEVLARTADRPDDSPLDWQAAIARYDRPERVFQPARSALLVVDMQRIFAHSDGSSFLSAAPAAVDNLSRLLGAFRRLQRPVLFTRHVHRDARQDGGAMARWWRSLIMEGSWGSEILDQLKPLEGERVITKSRYDAFANTELEMVLRSLQIEDLVIGGVMTNLCCETTAREAFVRDFNVFFLGDGTAASDSTLHLASLRNIAYGFGRVLSVDDALGLMAQGRPVDGD